MPANNPDTSATLELTIQKQTFTIPHRYVAGAATLTEGEAHALQQTYAENLRNNFAARMKAAAEQDPPVQLSQADLDSYVGEYDFGIRISGGIARNPVESAERSLAQAAVKVTLTSKGKSWKALTEEQQEALVDRFVATGKFRADAERLVEARKAARDAAKAAAADVEI
jgi:hypothetical protein